MGVAQVFVWLPCAPANSYCGKRKARNHRIAHSSVKYFDFIEFFPASKWWPVKSEARSLLLCNKTFPRPWRRRTLKIATTPNNGGIRLHFSCCQLDNLSGGGHRLNREFCLLNPARPQFTGGDHNALMTINSPLGIRSNIPSTRQEGTRTFQYARITKRQTPKTVRRN